MALGDKSGAHLVQTIEKLRDELYVEMNDRCRPDSLARALKISRKLDEVIIRLMKQDTDRSECP